MKASEMCPQTLLALAKELDRDAAFFERAATVGSIEEDLAARLRGIAVRYRKRARLAKGGWRAVQDSLRAETKGT